MYSVLMSVYKKESPEHLRESVMSMAEQTVPPDDFVLYCDGRLTEALYVEIEKLRLRCPVLNVIYGERNQGLGRALGKALGYCKNDIVARMDSDDIAAPDRMEITLRAFSDYGADIVSGTVTEFEGSIDNVISSKRLPENDSEIKKYARRRNPFNHPCTSFRKQCVYLAGNYRHCPYFEDYWLWVRMLGMGFVGHNVPESLLYMRSGKDMYKRRGGRQYMGCALYFRRKMFKTGFCSRWDYILACIGHIISAALPNKLRMFLYSKILRK